MGHIIFSEGDLKAITSAREKRNEIEHYEFTLENQEAKVLVGQVLAFILKFSENELALEWNSLCSDGNKWRVIYQYKEFYESLLNSTNEKIETEEIEVIKCPSCHNETFDIEKEYCLLCGHKEEILECVVCKSPYLYSTVEYEEAGLCAQCEWEDGYAAANHEKY